MLLELKDASFSYPLSLRPAAENLNLRIGEGEFVGIMGRTGCGKSTVIQLLAGLLSPASGSVLFDGADVNAPGRRGNAARCALRRSVGVVFQYPETQLFGTTVERDIAFGPRNLFPGETEAEIDSRVREALSLVGLDYSYVAGHSPLVFSGGEKRRIAIAGVLASRPRVLLLDEPAAGLDPASRASFLSLLSGLNRAGTTIVMVSHDADAIAEQCSRLVVMEDGRICSDGTVSARAPSCVRIVTDSSAHRAACALADRGIPIPQDIFRYEELRSSVIAYAKGRRASLFAPAECVAGLPNAPAVLHGSAGRAPVLAGASVIVRAQPGPLDPASRRNLLERLNPCVKLALFLCIAAASLAVESPASFALIAFSSVPALAFSSEARRSAAAQIAGLAWFVFFVCALNFLFFSPESAFARWWIFSPSIAGAAQGARIAVRIALITVFSAVLTSATTPVDLTAAFELLLSPLALLRVPVSEVAMILGIALRFVPVLQEEADLVRKAQTARGAHWRRAAGFLPLVVPVFLASFARADELALAMEARGYRGSRYRTKRRRAPFGLQDAAAILACALVCIPALLL